MTTIRAKVEGESTQRLVLPPLGYRVEEGLEKGVDDDLQSLLVPHLS